MSMDTQSCLWGYSGGGVFLLPSTLTKSIYFFFTFSKLFINFLFVRCVHINVYKYPMFNRGKKFVRTKFEVTKIYMAKINDFFFGFI